MNHPKRESSDNDDTGDFAPRTGKRLFDIFLSRHRIERRKFLGVLLAFSNQENQPSGQILPDSAVNDFYDMWLSNTVEARLLSEKVLASAKLASNTQKLWLRVLEVETRTREGWAPPGVSKLEHLLANISERRDLLDRVLGDDSSDRLNYLQFLWTSNYPKFSAVIDACLRDVRRATRPPGLVDPNYPEVPKPPSEPNGGYTEFYGDTGEVGYWTNYNKYGH